MSTGYSGNLGFPLPKDWAFDQIATITVGARDGRIEIDKDVASGRDPGQNQFTPRGPDGLLDVPFDRARRDALAVDLAAYIIANGHDDWYRARKPGECLDKILDMDALITGLARSFRMRKSLIQAVAFWEYQADITDDAVDLLVAGYFPIRLLCSVDDRVVQVGAQHATLDRWACRQMPLGSQTAQMNGGGDRIPHTAYFDERPRLLPSPARRTPSDSAALRASGCLTPPSAGGIGMRCHGERRSVVL